MEQTKVLGLNKPSLKEVTAEEQVNPTVNTAVTPSVLGNEIVDGSAYAPVEPGTETIVPGGIKPKGLAGGGNYYGETAPLVSSWESNAESQSRAKFEADVLAGKQTGLKNAQQIEQQGQQGQTELALGEYMRGQSAEKAGWTGGYMLDQKRQGDYLKATIQAQMYGAQELQKYGMDTQLEAARLAYDLGKDQLAYQMYQEAQQLAITEAGMFGYYVSPEVKDMVNQLTAAQNELVDDPENERALRVKAQIEEWFGEEGINPQDLSSFGKLTMEREQYNQAKLDAVLASIGDDPSTFLARDAEGRYQVDPATGQYIKLNFQDISKEDLLTFLNKDNESEYKYADQTFKSYARYLGQFTINTYFASLEEDEEPTSDGFNEFLAASGNDQLKAFFNGLGLEEGEQENLTEILGEGFAPSLTKDGITVTYSLAGGSASQPTQSGGGAGGAAVFNPEWYTSNGFTDFTEHVNNRTFNKIQEFTYKNNEGNNVTRYTFNGTVLDDQEVAVIKGSNSFTYNLKFFDAGNWNDKYWEDVPWTAAGYSGMDQDFKMNISKANGNNDELSFKLGSNLASYFGILGIGVGDADLTYKTIGSDGKAITVVSQDTLKEQMKVGEMRAFEVSYGSNSRKYFLVKDGNGNLRPVTGKKNNMESLLGYYGIENTGFQYT